MTTWVTRTGVRWAWDEAGRERFGLADVPAEHLALRARPGPRRGGALRRLRALARPDAAARRRLHHRHQPGRPAGRGGRSAGGADRPSSPAATTSATGSTCCATRWSSSPTSPRGEEWQFAQAHRELAALGREPRTGTPSSSGCTDVRALLRTQSGRSADPGELPHRHPHRLHDDPDARGAAPGGLPARPRRRCLPARWLDRRRRRAGPAAQGRRARRPQRGPPAVPRRDHVRRRAPGDHLHRVQRVHRPAAAAVGPAARAPRRGRGARPVGRVVVQEHRHRRSTPTT